jgi:ElaA protein
MIRWQDLHHSELTVADLYALLKLRCEVFIVEQTCPYLDVDGDDLVGQNRHLLGWKENQLVAYARILKSEDDLEPVVIGRVIVSEQVRGEKIGLPIDGTCGSFLPATLAAARAVSGAQAHLQHFYARFGFVPVTDVYDEDGILHIGMAREVRQA